MLFEPTNIEVLIRLINLKERNVGGTKLITNLDTVKKALKTDGDPMRLKIHRTRRR